jgi:ankyrin repeat protein
MKPLLSQNQSGYFILTMVITAAPFLLTGCGTSIHDAVARHDCEFVAAMLKENPDIIHVVDSKGKTALHAAVSYSKVEMMPLLVEAGANINSQDITGMTPLHVAGMLGRAEEAAWLLEHGADPSIEDDFGDTPLHTAAVFGSGQIIKLLVAHGVSPEKPNGNGESLVAIAKAYRQEKVVQYLDFLSSREK